jgi:hypothetical protein
MPMIPRVIDISHHNTVKDLKATASAGVWGVIHKASQGRAYRDPDYAGRRKLAAAAGLLWGAYHFNTGDDVASQVDNFLKAAQPDPNTLLVLDYEDNRPSQMSIKQAVQFLHLIEQKDGPQSRDLFRQPAQGKHRRASPDGAGLSAHASAVALPVRAKGRSAEGLQQILALAIHGRRGRASAA